MEVQYNGLIYYIPRGVNETNEMLSARAWYIAKQSPKSLEEFSEYTYYSYYWVNVNMLGCTYSPEIMNKVKKIEKEN